MEVWPTIVYKCRVTTTSLKIPDLSIVVPCLNEEENIPGLLKSLNDVVERYSLAIETILIDDLSDDNTFQVALSHSPHFPKLNLKVIRRYHPRRGYGAVVRYGIAHALGRYCVIVSADLVDPLDLLPEFLKRAEAGADLVQCSRYVSETDHANLPFKFKISHFFYRRLVKAMMGREISDSTYPFRIFNRIEMMALGITQNSFSISPEIFFKLILNGGKVEYLPHSQGMRQKGESKFRFRREGIRYGYVLLRAWLHKIGIMLWF